MTLRDRRRYDMLIRLRNFGAAHDQRFPETSTAHAAFAVIAAEITRLEALDVAEHSASQGRRARRKDEARKALADCLTRATQTARVLAKTNPTLDAQIDLPLPPDDLPLLTMARQFAAAATPCAADFAAHGIPIPDVESRTAAFEQALQDRGVRLEDRVKARAEIDASFSRALDAVAVLDVNVANCLASDSVALAVWKHDRRLKYPRPASTGEPAAPASPAEPAPSQPATGHGPEQTATVTGVGDSAPHVSGNPAAAA
jgi:hypothetical protein